MQTTRPVYKWNHKTQKKATADLQDSLRDQHAKHLFSLSSEAMVRATIAAAIFLSLFAAIQATPETPEVVGTNNEYFVNFEPHPIADQFLEASYIPVHRGHPETDLQLIGHPRQRHARRFGRGTVIPLEDGAVLSPEELRRFHVGRQSFIREFGRPQGEVGQENSGGPKFHAVIDEDPEDFPCKYHHRHHHHRRDQGGFMWNLRNLFH